jgi:hypothetical protein
MLNQGSPSLAGLARRADCVIVMILFPPPGHGHGRSLYRSDCRPDHNKRGRRNRLHQFPLARVSRSIDPTPYLRLDAAAV